MAVKDLEEIIFDLFILFSKINAAQDQQILGRRHSPELFTLLAVVFSCDLFKEIFVYRGRISAEITQDILVYFKMWFYSDVTEPVS